MGSATTVETRTPGFRSVAEAIELLDRLLSAADADQRVGPLLRAARLSVRFEFTDLELGLSIRSADADLDHCLEWSFAERPGFRSRLLLEMSSAVANAYLQGRESLPIAIARQRVRCRCEARDALRFLPAARLLCAPYREIVVADYPHLLVSGQPPRGPAED